VKRCLAEFGEKRNWRAKEWCGENDCDEKK
jgi:hypothetical protein